MREEGKSQSAENEGTAGVWRRTWNIPWRPEGLFCSQAECSTEAVSLMAGDPRERLHIEQEVCLQKIQLGI